MDKNIILNYIKEHPGCSSKQISDAVSEQASLATVKRIINEFVTQYYVTVEGKARATRYTVSPLFMPINLDEYFSKEVDEREVQTSYNFDLIPNVLSKVDLFTPIETDELNGLQVQFSKNLS